ncbi:hypothetical protein [Burkholderia sp. Ac-20353]|uniref:hypothetical protein n=1 Tax=Burkholderia sp. Ac-20353 TaxID=2703894 RepID=UPI00197B7590|nr:hypothetical protein [Burkholderia sp. Ac-20353]MBN3785939.1 hypothetical protein [Burkholderia sp. Ac-20353]
MGKWETGTHVARSIASSVSIALALLALSPESFAQKCDGIDTTLTDARRAEYATLVSKVFGTRVRTQQVEVLRFFGAGNWSAVEAATPVADIGVFFFNESQGRKHFEDVWGGDAEEAEVPMIVKWARKIGAPAQLAQCFAWSQARRTD